MLEEKDMGTAKNYIDGKWVPCKATFDVVSPVTGERLATVAASGRDEVNAAVAAAKSAFESWSKTPLGTRCSITRKMADWLKTQYGEEGKPSALKQRIMEAVGKPLPEADVEIIETAGFIEYFCDIASQTLDPRAITVNQTLWPTKASSVTFEPIGVIAVIKPWNYPLELPFWAIAPALITGNTVVFKPSEKSPTVGLVLAEIADAIGMPAGVLNIITGDRDTGCRLVEHPDVAMVSFTGSVRAGRSIAETCGKNLKKVSLELGGNDAAIVLSDANVELAANGLVWGAFCNAGQVCVGIKRALVPREIKDQLVREIVEKTKALRLGADVGPVIDEAQIAAVEGFVQDAVKGGARVLVGGKRAIEQRGTYYNPTVLVDVNPGMRIWKEECFGPLLPIITVENEAEAVRLANDSVYGLGASVWTTDRIRGIEVARALNVGMVWVNDVNVAFAEAPWGGVKASGLGFELSPEALLEYTFRKHVSVEKSADTHRLWWYPYG